MTKTSKRRRHNPEQIIRKLQDAESQPMTALVEDMIGLNAVSTGSLRDYEILDEPGESL